MNEHELTTTDLIKAVHEVAAEQPDHVYDNYDGCRYYTEEAGDFVPSCIVGHAFDRLNVPRDAILKHNAKGIKAMIKSYDGRSPIIDCRIDSEYDLLWLDNVQFSQDTGASWGKAVSSADGENESA